MRIGANAIDAMVVCLVADSAVLVESSIGGTMRAKRSNVESGSAPPSFRLDLALKDLRIAGAIADRAGPPLTVTSAAREWLARAAEAGAGSPDFSAVPATYAPGKGGRT